MKTYRGFTLSEIIIAMAVLALITAITVPTFQNSLMRNKVRKTSDLITQTVVVAQNEALRRNVKIYVQYVSGNMCIGTTAGGCDIRSEPVVTGVSVSATQLVLSPFYGAPSPAPATFTVSFSGISQVVNVNKLGIVTVGALSWT